MGYESIAHEAEWAIDSEALTNLTVSYRRANSVELLPSDFTVNAVM